MPSEFFFNHRFVYEVDTPKAPEAPQPRVAETLSKPLTTPESRDLSDKHVAEAKQQGTEIINKYRNTLQNPENLNDTKLEELAKTHPESVLGSAEQLKDRPEYPKLIETAARTAAEKNPSAAVVLDNAFAKEPYHREVVTVAFNNLAQSDPRMVLGFAPIKLGNSSETNALLAKAQANMARFNHYAKSA